VHLLRFASTAFSYSVPGTLAFLRRLLPLQRGPVSLDLLIYDSSIDERLPNFWSELCNLCNEAGLGLKELFVTAIYGEHNEDVTVLDGFPLTRLTELLLHPDFHVLYGCGNQAAPLPKEYVGVLGNLGKHPRAYTGRESGGSVYMKMYVTTGESLENGGYLPARGSSEEAQAARIRVVELVPEYKVLLAD